MLRTTSFFRRDSLFDVDFHGERYPTARIGCDCWTAENLRSTRYQQDGNAAPDTKFYYTDVYPDATANKAIYGLPL